MCGLSMIFAAGCGNKKDLDYNNDLGNNGIEVTESKTSTSDEASEVSETTESSVTTEEAKAVDLEYQVDSRQMVVKANIEGDVGKNGSTVKISSKKYTEEEIKKIADEFFDDGKYDFYLDPSQGDTTYLNNRLEKLKQYEGEYSNEDVENTIWIHSEENLIEKAQKKQGEHADKYNVDEAFKLYYMTSDNDEGLEDCDYCYLEGKHNGKMYRMRYATKGDRTYLNIFEVTYDFENLPLSEFSKEDIQEINQEAESDTSLRSAYDPEIEVGEAEKMAYDYVSKFGLEDYVINEECRVMIPSMGANSDGIQLAYKFYMSKNIEGLQRNCHRENTFPYDSIGAYMADDLGEYKQPQFLDEECVFVIVDSDGVIEMTAYNPVEVDSVESGDKTLMSFEEIDSIAKGRFEAKDYKLFDGDEEEICIDTVRLGWAQISENGEMYLVPAWDYLYSPLDASSDLAYVPGGTKRSAICINAVDGSIIHEDVTGRLE